MEWMKRIGRILAGAIGVVLLLVLALFAFGRNRLNNAPTVAVAAVSVPTDSAAVEHGAYLATVSSCNYCHGESLEGEVFVDEAPIGYLPGPNLTSGAGGVGGSYSDADWARAIRHGVAADGRTMATMPVDHYTHYGDADLGDLIAYLKSVPPVDNDLGSRRLQFMGNIIFGVMAYSSWPVNVIDHAQVGGAAPQRAVSAEYGAYLVSIASCQSCHAENLAGNYGQLDTPRGPNLSTLQDAWTLDDFTTAMQTGRTPTGRQLSDEMPWPNYANMTAGDIEALWIYLNSIEALPDNEGG